jgi:hypothetical protein
MDRLPGASETAGVELDQQQAEGQAGKGQQQAAAGACLLQ